MDLSKDDDLGDLDSLFAPDLKIDCLSDGDDDDEPVFLDSNRYGPGQPEFIDTDFTQPLTAVCLPPPPPPLRWPPRHIGAYRIMDKAAKTSAVSPGAATPLSLASGQTLTLTPGMQAQPLNLSQGQMLNLRAAAPNTAVGQAIPGPFPGLQPLGSVNLQLGSNAALLSPTSPVQGQTAIMNTGNRFVNPPVAFNVNPVPSGATYISQPIQIISPSGYRQMLATTPARFVAQAGTNLGNAVLMPIQQNASILQPQHLQGARLLSPTSLPKTIQPKPVPPTPAASSGPDAHSQIPVPINLQVSSAPINTSPAPAPQVLNVPQFAHPSSPRVSTPSKLPPAVVSPTPVTVPQPLSLTVSSCQQQLPGSAQSNVTPANSYAQPHMVFSTIGQPQVAFATDLRQLQQAKVQSHANKPTDVNSNIAPSVGDEPCDLSKTGANKSQPCSSPYVEPPRIYSPAPGYVENIDSKPPNLDKQDLQPFTDKNAVLNPPEENVVSAIDLKQRKKARQIQEKLGLKSNEPNKSDNSTEVKEESPEVKAAVISEASPPSSGNVTIKYTAGGQIPVEFEEPEFLWEQYLEETGAQAAPPEAFQHVEASLATGFEKGMLVEVVSQSEPQTCWLATIQLVCGELLRLRYEGYGMDGSSDFWCAVNSEQLHPVNWASSHNVPRVIPEALKASIADEEAYWTRCVSSSRWVPEDVLERKSGLIPVDQIKLGMRVEVQNELKPTNVWLARVMENVGGRLLLRYEGTDRAVHDFWLFYPHWRLHPIGWARENDMLYKPPESILPEQPQESEWPKLLASGMKEAESMPFPTSLFKDQEEIPEHDFQVGWKLEALHPETRTQICPATVIDVIDKYWFTVAFDDMTAECNADRVQFCANAASQEIFPQQWCMYKGIKLTPPPGYDKSDFDWPEYLRDTNSAAAPEDSFVSVDIDTDFERGMKLEAVNPKQPGQICAATITRIVDRLMWIHLDGSPTIMPNHIVDVCSHEIFPVGWCESNNYPVKPPRKSGWRRTVGRHISVAQPVPMEGLMTADEFRSATYSQIKTAEAGATSAWCPKIYFNHKCFSGPYLSKGRIAELPKSVGPGPIMLVMKEVLTMLINVAYKSSRVLRELQMEDKPNPNMFQQQLKAKYKGKSYRAVVEICKSHNRIEAFCRQVCIKLECCPYLFSPNYINDNCPEACSQLTKTKYTYYYGKKKKRKVGRPPGGHTNLENGPKKPGKRGRRRKVSLMDHDKTSVGDSEESGNDAKDDVEDDKSSISSGRTEGRRDDDSNDGDYQPVRKKRKYTHHIPPPSMIKTRGAKLPKFTFERRTHKKIPVAPEPKPPEPKPVKVVKKEPEAERKNILKLDSNPLKWSVPQVIKFLKTTDCAHLAWMFKEQEIDGQALLLLTLPTLQEHLDLKLGPAIKLCHHIETIKIAFFEQFAK